MKLTASELKLIEQAVQKAEAHTRGEIVPVVVGSSREYPESWLMLALAGGIAAGLASWLTHEGLGPGWVLTVTEFSLEILAGAGVALALGWIAPFRRRVIGSEDLARAVHERAVMEFVEHGVMNTSDRCGILLLVSLFEHRAEIIADRGIYTQVPETFWQQELDQMLSELRTRGLAPALTQGIERLGVLLTEKFPREAGTTNELGDSLRQDR